MIVKKENIFNDTFKKKKELTRVTKLKIEGRWHQCRVYFGIFKVIICTIFLLIN